MIYSDMIITKKGMELIAKLQASGASTELKHIALGAGTDRLTDESVQLSDQRQIFQFDSVRQSEDRPEKITIRASPNNIGLETGYIIREIGIFAEDPDNGTILYAVINTMGDATAYDSFPAYSSEKDYKEIIFHIELLVANVDNTTFELNAESLREQVAQNTIAIEKLENRESSGMAAWGQKPSVTTFLGDQVVESFENGDVQTTTFEGNTVVEKCEQKETGNTTEVRTVFNDDGSIRREVTYELGGSV